MATFWALATLLALIVLAYCAVHWYQALEQQREGTRYPPQSRYWAPNRKNQDMT